MTVDQHTIESDLDRSRRRASTSPWTGTWHRRLDAARATIDRIAVRGQLGPTIGRRDDHRPDRMI